METFGNRFERFMQRVPRRPPLAQSTYCPLLWSDAFIDDRGTVFACCHMLPFAQGSLHHATLEEIWNGWRSRAARGLSLGRSLPCYDRCTLLDEGARAQSAPPGAATSAPYGQLRRLKILFGELCNLDCIMCSQDHKSRRQLSRELLERTVDFTNIDDIEFQGGEPLAMRECKEAFIWLTERLGKKVNFLTNGTLIDDPWAERICAGSDWLYVSINGASREVFERVNLGARLAKVADGVERVRRARDRLGSELVLVGHFTMVPENIHEVDRFPALCAELGFDSVDFGYDIATVPRWCREHPDEVARLRRSFDEVLENPPLPIRDHRLRRLGLIRPG